MPFSSRSYSGLDPPFIGPSPTEWGMLVVMSHVSSPPADPTETIYAVTATLPVPEVAQAYVRWLLEGHVQEVIRGGAASAEVVRLDPDPSQPSGGPVLVVSRYVFPTREAYDRYAAEHAPRLRAEGLAKFGPGAGRHAASFARTLGTTLGRF